MKSKSTLPQRIIFAELLIRIRHLPVRPAEPRSDALFSPSYDAHFECERDCEEIRSRALAEGMSFFTTTLPKFGKAIDMALTGHGTAFTTIPFRKESGCVYPEFLRYYSQRVFDANGTVRSDACPQSVRLLRQLTLSFYKLDVPYEKDLNDQIIQSFLQVDAGLPRYFSGFPRSYGNSAPDYEQRLHSLPKGNGVDLCEELGVAVRVARYIIGTVLGSCDPRNIRPRHGPGAVSTGESCSEKSHFSHITQRLERVYPFMEYMRFNLTHVCDTWDEPLAVKESGTAKVVLVPKDSRGPRLISCEPLDNQWIQQGQMDAIVAAIESHPLTRGQVNFKDQTINGALALQGSLSGLLATLDMKDASDRVSWALIELLFPLQWIEALYASRSSHTKLPTGRRVHLKKFAPMGSAVCFPVEALIFFALSVGSVYSKHIRLTAGSLGLTFYGERGFQINRTTLRKLCRTIYVYGDDLVTRTEDSGSVMAYLECFALRFNTSKCCVSGFFRESCGVDAFKGVNVTPVRFRTNWDESLTSPKSLISWVEYSNSLYEHGYVEAGNYLSTEILKRKKVPTVVAPAGSRFGGVCFIRPYPGSPGCNARRYNPYLMRCEARMDVVVPAVSYAATLGWDELLRDASLKSESPRDRCLYDASIRRAGVYAVPRRYKLKRGWVAI